MISKMDQNLFRVCLKKNWTRMCTVPYPSAPPGKGGATLMVPQRRLFIRYKLFQRRGHQVELSKHNKARFIFKTTFQISIIKIVEIENLKVLSQGCLGIAKPEKRCHRVRTF